MNVETKLRRKNLWKDFNKEIKSIKYSFIMILFSASFVLSLGVVHTYHGLPEDKNLYTLAVIAYILSFVLKRSGLKYTANKYRKMVA